MTFVLKCYEMEKNLLKSLDEVSLPLRKARFSLIFQAEREDDWQKILPWEAVVVLDEVRQADISLVSFMNAQSGAICIHS